MKERESKSPDPDRVRAQEDLIVSVSNGIWKAMQDVGRSKVELARSLHSSKSHVTQLLDGTRNFTLRTLADVATALGRRVEVHFAPLDACDEMVVTRVSEGRDYAPSTPGVREIQLPSSPARTVSSFLMEAA